MLTLFTIPKPFTGHIEIIQRNAIQSWLHLRPAYEIILVGDDEGTAETAAEFGGRHIPQVARDEYGTPLLDDVFEKAERLSRYDLLCFINADIILMHDFTRAVQQVGGRKDRFVMVGQRWDLDVTEALSFGQHWEETLHADVADKGKLHTTGSTDYLVFARGTWGQIPPFAVGRTVYDYWLLWRARSLNVPVIDATRVVKAVHQNHYSSHRLPREGGMSPGDVEAKRNLELAGGASHLFSVWNSSHILTPHGVKWALRPMHAWYHLKCLPAFHPRLSLPVRLLIGAINLTHPMRARVGFTLRGEGHGTD